MAEAAFLLQTKWSWRDYQEAPDDIVEKMLILMSAKNEVIKSRQDGE